MTANYDNIRSMGIASSVYQKVAIACMRVRQRAHRIGTPIVIAAPEVGTFKQVSCVVSRFRLSIMMTDGGSQLIMRNPHLHALACKSRNHKVPIHVNRVPALADNPIAKTKSFELQCEHQGRSRKGVDSRLCS